ncbi:MAG: hypothetical protein WED34_10265 [Planctomycetales bacterium]
MPRSSHWSRRAIRFAATVLATLAAISCCGDAVAQEFTLRGHDLEVQVDGRWAGNAYGGYWPVRVRAVNKRAARTVTFRVAAGDGVPAVEQRLDLDQNATRRFTLLVPQVGDGAHGQFEVLEQGRRLDKMSGSVTMAAAESGANPRPALLVVSSTAKDCQQFEDAATLLVAEHGVISSGHSYGYGGPSRSEDHEVVQPATLPETWLAYTGLDIVAIRVDELTGLPAEQRGAIVAWVRTGGTLLVYGLTPGDADRARLDSLLNVDDQGFADPEWLSPARPPSLMIPQLSSHDWSWSADAFAQRRWMLGRVIAFRGDPFPGTPADWSWLLRSVGRENYVWPERNGVQSRMPAADFLEFSIPGVAGVPVYAFLTLITLFTIVIGPVNYVFCRRKNRMSLLVLTIPAIALATSLTLFGYSAVAHGFGVKSRVRSVTFLDQPAQTAVATSRIAFFAGMAPSGGLQFSPETAVFPVWPDAAPFDGGTVDWTKTQDFASGWLKSRTRTQFRTVTHRAARERLEVAPSAAGGLDVTNGLAWDLALLIATDENGDPFATQHLPRGAATRLAPAASRDWQAVRAALAADGAADPRHSVRTAIEPLPFVQRMMTGAGAAEFTGRLAAPNLAVGPAPLPPNSYFAILKANPGVDSGATSASERVGLHLLVGRY